MKNSKIKKLLIIFMVLVVVLASFQAVQAKKEDKPPKDKPPKAGITPANPFYFLDEWMEKIVYFFTVGIENKTEKLLEFAEEKLAETQELLEKNEVSYAEKARDKYKEYLDDAQELAKKAKDEGDVGLADKLINLITQKTLEHQGTLTEDFSENLPEKLPEGVRKIILNIIEISGEGFRKALQAISTREKRTELLERVKDLREEIDKKIEIIRENIGI